MTEAVGGKVNRARYGAFSWCCDLPQIYAIRQGISRSMAASLMLAIIFCSIRDLLQ
jgi:hypothetical protein